MATIDKIPLTNAESLNLLQGTSTTPFQLTDYEDGTSSLAVAGGRTEEIGGYLYSVNDGDYLIDTTAAVVNGIYYVLVKDDGTGSADAYLSTKAGTWDSNKGGYYVNDESADDGAKVVIAVFKAASVWRDRVRADKIRNNTAEINELTVRNGLTVFQGITRAGVTLSKIVMEIGDWNINASSTTTVTRIGWSAIYKRIRSLNIVIRNDADTVYYDSSYSPVIGSVPVLGTQEITNNHVTLFAGTPFQNTSFNSTSYNRGWVTIEFETIT